MEEMNMHKTQGGPIRVHRSHSNIKNKTNRRPHEEHWTRNNVGVDHGRDSVAPRLHFLFFLLLLSQFSQYPSMLNLGTLYSAPFTPIYIQKWHLVDLQLTQASWDLAMKQLAHLGEPETGVEQHSLASENQWMTVPWRN